MSFDRMTSKNRMKPLKSRISTENARNLKITVRNEFYTKNYVRMGGSGRKYCTQRKLWRAKVCLSYKIDVFYTI